MGGPRPQSRPNSWSECRLWAPPPFPSLKSGHAHSKNPSHSMSHAHNTFPLPLRRATPTASSVAPTSTHTSRPSPLPSDHAPKAPPSPASCPQAPPLASQSRTPFSRLGRHFAVRRRAERCPLFLRQPRLQRAGLGSGPGRRAGAAAGGLRPGEPGASCSARPTLVAGKRIIVLHSDVGEARSGYKILCQKMLFFNC